MIKPIGPRSMPHGSQLLPFMPPTISHYQSLVHKTAGHKDWGKYYSLAGNNKSLASTVNNWCPQLLDDTFYSRGCQSASCVFRVQIVEGIKQGHKKITQFFKKCSFEWVVWGRLHLRFAWSLHKCPTFAVTAGAYVLPITRISIALRAPHQHVWGDCCSNCT